MWEAAAPSPYLHSDSQLWRIATCWHADAVPSPNCLLSSFWTSAVTLTACSVCECCAHIFTAWFLWWLPDTNCFCHQAPKIQLDSALTISFRFFFLLSLSLSDINSSERRKAQMRRLRLTMWQQCLSRWQDVGLLVTFSHYKSLHGNGWGRGDVCCVEENNIKSYLSMFAQKSNNLSFHFDISGLNYETLCIQSHHRDSS